MTTKLLANQYRGILSDPVEGFTVELQDESSLYEWKVYIEGPRDTPYEGGVFQLLLSFPKDYPMSPPVLKFLSDFWHPNVYTDGKVCMSILHPPGEDAMSGELPQERWLPTQSVTTIVLSLLSLLNDPNCSSPANIDASVEWRKGRDSYIAKCKRLVEKANREKPPHVQIPHPDTNEEEHKRVVQKWKEMNSDMGHEEFYEDEVRNNTGDDSDDENENEFLESNEEMNTEDNEEEEEDEEEKPKPKVEGKEDKGKAPALSRSTSESSSGAAKEVIIINPPPEPEPSRPIDTISTTSVASSDTLHVEKANSLSNNPGSTQSSLHASNSSSSSPGNVSISNDDASASSVSGEQSSERKGKRAKGGKKKKCIVM